MKLRINSLIRAGLFTLIMLMGMVIFARNSFAFWHAKPVIDDQLNILTDQQKQQIMDENEKLANKPYHQEIWFISTNQSPYHYDSVNSSLDLETIKESGFSLLSLQDATQIFAFDLIQDYTNLSENSTDIDVEEKLDGASSYINIIVVDPKFKYPVMPIFSDISKDHIGDLRNRIMTHQLNFKDYGQANVMDTVNFVTSFVNTKSTNPKDNQGMSEGDLWLIAIGLIILWGIVHHIRHRHDPQGPSHVDPEMDDASARYDNGWLDGVFYGENSGDDSFKN